MVTKLDEGLLRQQHSVNHAFFSRSQKQEVDSLRLCID